MLQVATNSGSTATIEDTRLGELQMSLRGPIITAGDAGYDDARLLYNGAFDKKPGAIIRARSTADVIDGVNLAREHDLLLALRGGGHNVAGSSGVEAGLVIDLTEMTGVYVDRKSSTVRAQGGATWGDVDRESQAFGLAVREESCLPQASPA